MAHAADTAAYWAQAVGTVLAIFATIALFVTQRCRDSTRDKARTTAVRKAIVDITRKAIALVTEVAHPTDVYSTVGTWDQYKAFRSRQFMEFHDIIAQLPVRDVSELDLLDVTVSLRVSLHDMAKVIAEASLNIPANWRGTLGMIGHCRGNLSEVALKLGIVVP
jgi:hypothetical protein